MKPTSGFASKIEDNVDAFSLAAVLATLSEVCSQKAEHIRYNWQDESTAMLWEAVQRQLERVEAYAANHGL